MHSIELLLDPATDAAVRAEWGALADAGLPSQSRHTGETNAPHLTLAARRSIGGEFDDRLQDQAEALPVPFELGGLVVFGAPPHGSALRSRGDDGTAPRSRLVHPAPPSPRLVLARLAVATPRLLSLHEAVHDALRGPTAEADAPHTLPGHWTPHVTLASRLTPDQLARAVEVLAAARTAESDAASAVALRRWDSTARTVTPLRPPQGAGGA